VNYSHPIVASLRNPIPRWFRLLSFLILTWASCWLVSVLSFYVQSGLLPHGNLEWWGYPIECFWLFLPVSFGGFVRHLLGWWPPAAANTIGLICIFAYWPAYIILLIFAARTRELIYFGAVAVLSLAAAVYWHTVSIGAIGV
jgi:hypothetical protein